MQAKRILVTGASRGIGRAICLRLAAAGADIVACASSHPEELHELVQEIRGSGRRACSLLGDLFDPAVPGQLVKDAVAEMGGLDAVVSNAGCASPGKLTHLDPGDWDRVFAINVRAPWLLAVAAHPWLKQGRGTFVAVSSMSGMQPYSGMGAYSPSKAALIMLVRQLAQEWAEDGIRVNGVAPGLVRTPLSQACYDSPATKSAREALVPVHRIAEADVDVAGIVAFLVSADAAYLTGQNILADGGLLDSIQTHLVGRPSSDGRDRQSSGAQNAQRSQCDQA